MRLKDLTTWVLTGFLAIIIAFPCFSQPTTPDSSATDSVAADTNDLKLPEVPGGFIFKPTLGLGVGMFTFYGDISKPYKLNHPIVSRIGYDLRVTQNLTEFLDLSFYVLFGKLGANERSLDRNLNFESKITTGGMALSYNFYHLLPEERTIDPYVSLGFESFEYLSKTDLVDAFGNTYYYWSDGSIRNIDESDSDANNAIRLQRDYTYESDIREMNVDSFGKYPERSWAIPIGIGANLHITEKWSFRIGTTMHFGFSDYLDGVTDKSVGNRIGDAANDRFLFTSFNLNYNLVRGPKKPRKQRRKKEKIDESLFNDVDFLALNTADMDQDSVIDFEDRCPDTPLGIEVDKKGCPLDGDDDGVPDYLDKELNSLDKAVVDMDGVTISDSLLELRYLRFMDTTGKFAKTTRTQNASEGIDLAKLNRPKYQVKIGDYTEAIPLEIADLYLSIPGMKTIQKGNTTIFVVGEYDTKDEAAQIRYELESKGFNPTTVIKKDDKGSMVTVDVSDVKVDKTKLDTVPGTTFRLQLGAFSRRIPNNVFSDVKDLVVAEFDDGLTRYYTRDYDNLADANKRKFNLALKGYRGAFVVPFRDGKRISLSEAGAHSVNSNVEEELSKAQYDNDPPTVDPKLVKFKVQVGVFEKVIKPEELDKLITLGNVEQDKTKDGKIRYLVETFDDYASAEAYKARLIKKGLKRSIVVGKFKGEIISAEEALELIK